MNRVQRNLVSQEYHILLPIYSPVRHARSCFQGLEKTEGLRLAGIFAMDPPVGMEWPRVARVTVGPRTPVGSTSRDSQLRWAGLIFFECRREGYFPLLHEGLPIASPRVYRNCSSLGASRSVFSFASEHGQLSSQSMLLSRSLLSD